jgi:hypothetical protein
MQVGSIYSCKWLHRQHEYGWDMLVFLGMMGDAYLFYDMLKCEKKLIHQKLTQYCKQLNAEDS